MRLSGLWAYVAHVTAKIVTVGAKILLSIFQKSQHAAESSNRNPNGMRASERRERVGSTETQRAQLGVQPQSNEICLTTDYTDRRYRRFSVIGVIELTAHQPQDGRHERAQQPQPFVKIPRQHLLCEHQVQQHIQKPPA